jgi:hypothetical protein
VRGVNAAEHAIRQIAAMIRSKLDETVQAFDRGLSLNDLGELQRMPAEPRPGRHPPQALLASPRRTAHRSRAGLPAARRAVRP